jgi:acyl carrier protein
MSELNKALKTELKALIISTLDLEDIETKDIINDEPLFVDGLGLDSIDALELGLAVKKKYDIVLNANDEATKKHFHSIDSLAKFISNQ